MNNPVRIDWSAAGDAELADIIELRRAIHRDPEVGLHCPRTADKIRAALAGLPLEIHEGRSTTGLVAILRPARGGTRDNGRTVLLRGDHDALPMPEETGLPFASTVPGAMHACGHDAHTAMLVGAARALCARAEELPGTIVFMFQPGEEGHHGARFMIEDGLLDIVRPEVAFALHLWPNLPAGTLWSRPGPLMASADTIRCTVRGRGGHGAMPHDCLDPVPVACEIVTALQTYIARQVPVTDPAVLTIARIAAGSTHNVIPGEVEMLGTLRTLSERTREQMHDAFARIATHIALAHGATAEPSVEPGYPVTVNDARAVEMVREASTQLGAEWQEMTHPMMGAEDFSYVLREVPGAMTFLGAAPAGSDPALNPPLHNTRMVVEEAVMARGVALHCTLAERFLLHGFG